MTALRLDSYINAVRVAIGIDIGGTKIAVAAVDREGTIQQRTVLATDAELGFAPALQRIAGGIEQVLRASGSHLEDLHGIGIGCAGPVNPLRGTIHNPYTLPGWDGCDIVTPLQERFAVPAFLENDADVAALGECFVGAGRRCNPLVMLTFGTGIGGGAIVNGEILRGAAGEHPEIGHIPVEAEGPPCYCGRAGCLESIASGTGIENAGRHAGFTGCREVFAAAAQGNASAREIVDRALRATEVAAWTLLHTFLPERIVLGGGIMDEQYEPFAAAIRRAITAATMTPRERVNVVKAMLGNDAALVGAASLVFKRSNRSD